MQTTATTRTYAIDPAHSDVSFQIRHLMLTKVRGTFHGLTGTIALDGSGEIPSAIEVSIDAASIDTREEKRDAHLRSADFFDAATYPELTFRSTSITGSGTSFTAVGDLTIHGTTKTVTLTGNVAGTTKDPWGNHRIGWSATTRINRLDFGVSFNAPLETGGVMLAEDVDITLEIQAIPAK